MQADRIFRSNSITFEPNLFTRYRIRRILAGYEADFLSDLLAMMAKLYIDGEWTTTLKRKAERQAAVEAMTSPATLFSLPSVTATKSPLSRTNMARATAVLSGITPLASSLFTATAETAPTSQTIEHTSATPSPSVTTISAIVFSIGDSSARTLPNPTVTLQDSKDRINGDIQLLGCLYRGLETDYFKLTGRFTTNISPTHSNVVAFKKANYQDSDFLFDLQDDIADSSAVATKRTALWNKEDIKGKGVDRPGAREGIITAESHKVKALIARYLKVRNDLKQLRVTLENMNRGKPAFSLSNRFLIPVLIVGRCFRCVQVRSISRVEGDWRIRYYPRSRRTCSTRRDLEMRIEYSSNQSCCRRTHHNSHIQRLQIQADYEQIVYRQFLYSENTFRPISKQKISSKLSQKRVSRQRFKDLEEESPPEESSRDQSSYSFLP